MKTCKLISGAELRITPGAFGESKALYQSYLEELKALKMEAKTELDFNFYKDVILSALASKNFEACLYVCMRRCVYKGKRLENVDEVFEDLEARGDYFEVCFEVAKENLLPFLKNLSQKYAHFLGDLRTLLLSNLQKTI
jgi:hypothetical protein